MLPRFLGVVTKMGRSLFIFTKKAENQQKQPLIWWRGLDSNQRRRTPADLQSAPFSHSGTPPESCCLIVVILDYVNADFTLMKEAWPKKLPPAFGHPFLLLKISRVGKRLIKACLARHSPLAHQGADVE